MNMRWQLKLKRYVCQTCYSHVYCLFLNAPAMNLMFQMLVILQMYDLAYLKAKEMLQKNRRVLEKIVEELLEFEILTGKVTSCQPNTV